MNITKVNLYNYDETYRKEHHITNRLLCLADIDIDYDFRIKGIKVYSGDKGEYLVFPVGPRGNFMTHPITDEARQLILDKILEEYNEHK